MEDQRNSNCWYLETCNEDCNRCITYTQLKWQMDNSGLYPAQQKPISLYINDSNEVDREAYKRLAEIKKNIVNYIQEGNNLYICGENTGSGKTSWSIKLLHSYFHYCAENNYENLLGMFVNTTDLLLKLKDFNNPLPQKYKDNLENVDLVVFDDIAVTGISQYDFTQFFNIINKRLSAKKSNIYTSNITSCDQLEKILGVRLASRIYEASEIIKFKGMDMR